MRRSLSGSQSAAAPSPQTPRSPDMGQALGPGARALLLLLLLACLPPPGNGNEGTVTGSCHCSKRISSDSPPSAQFMNRLRKHLRAYHHCLHYIRFQLPSWSVCGGSKDPWVRELMSCLDLKECGHAYLGSVAHQEHLPPTSTPISQASEGASSDIRTPTQMLLSILQSTQCPIPPAGSLSLDKELTRPSETTIPTAGHSLGVGLEAGENQKQLKNNAGPTAGTSATVPVLSLLAIVFILTALLSYVLCKRRRGQSPQSSPDLQLHYIPVASDSNT
uniref:C-X-C motif chemokine 16 n=1 Tax=Macaca nemestrina TaxID=9545 RepID=A0A2K6DNQ3_MACNE|nr:C-X-C motif chemokine 16 [Macaca nemestrina]XP_011723704.1 C-X-C motif chemokine 16 [Macaca nemestrina]